MMVKYFKCLNTVNMTSLRSFAPDTIGMTYNKPDGTSALIPLGNDKFYIPQGVKTCFIRVNKNNNCHYGVRNFKGVQLKKMLVDLQPTKKKKVSESTQSVLQNQHIQDNVTIDQKTVKCNINEKHIRSRWYHCNYDCDKYLQKSDSKYALNAVLILKGHAIRNLQFVYNDNLLHGKNESVCF